MDKLTALKMFIATVDTGGFSAAGRRLDVATSSVTRMVTLLEEELGTVLLNRSTRQVTVTQAGQIYYENAQRILGELADADALIRDRGDEPSGPLRISLPVILGRDVVGPNLDKFIKRYPSVDLDITVTDSISELLSDRVDLAIRIGAPAPMKGVVSRTISDFERWVVATPEYLAKFGEPESPQDLLRHSCLMFNYHDGLQTWNFRKEQQELRIPINGRYRSNNAEMLLATALASGGIALLTDWLVAKGVAKGKLSRLFRDYKVNPDNAQSVVSALYLPNQRGSSRVNAFIDFFASEMQGVRSLA